MEIRISTTTPGRLEDEAVLLPLAKGEDGKASAQALGRAHGAAYATLTARKGFEGSEGEVQVLLDGVRARVPVLVLAGTGKDGRKDDEALRNAVAAGARAARDAGARSLTVLVPGGGARVEAAVEGAVLGLYRFEPYKGEKSSKVVERLTLRVGAKDVSRAERAAEHGRIVGEAVCLARDLGNEPGNTATPTYLADRAREIAEAEGLGLEVLEEADMERLGMGALLGVARGSREPAKLIILTYEPQRTRGRVPTVALVGKGLTFDSGGISIKPGNKMEDMKFDMCGGAAVLASMQAVARLGVRVRVVGLVPASENLPDGASYKPGDILKAMNGVTIEIRNTDAEGRLILADALSYASGRMKPRPKAMIDLATLTGACVVALGDQCAGLVSSDDKLAARVAAAGEASGDAVWRLPLKPGYRKQLESPYADLSNLGSPPGAGALTAAAFLERFTGGLPWAHLDIAGVAWTEKQAGVLRKGATGFGVRLLARLLRDWR